ncbi:hypothetical protein [Scytonema sp. NUACC26]|uniref:hypothetical protein n=1 Tax=Scytonema sp. NUACC26 TaxID=3140176 RepID=UPI0038B38867
MLQSIKGVYKHGKVELTELPSDVSESPVIVTFGYRATGKTSVLNNIIKPNESCSSSALICSI